MAATTVRTVGGEMLDDICHRHYNGRSKTVELVLDANPGLASCGAVLPANIDIVLPELPAIQKTVVKLWD